MLADVVTARLRATGAWREVRESVLVSADGAREASKSAIAGALRDLAQAVRPEDFVLISFATHGFTSEAGEFYLVPADVRPRSDPDWVASCVSSAELTDWLEPVRARDIALVIDACAAEGAWDRAGFKPLPLGDRTFGQLALDKGIRILAASQKAGVALESRDLRHGFLTHALVEEGLGERFQADRRPADGRLTLLEWLEYAEDRVPALAEEVQTGRRRGVVRRGIEGDFETVPPGASELAQRPSLFAHSLRDDPLIAVRRR
jgi:uncharacterized caspase-like protein